MTGPSRVRILNPDSRARISSPNQPEIVVVPGGVAGGGSGGFVPVEWQAPAPQTTHLVTHALGRDPIAVQVIIDGEETDFYSLTFPSPGQTFMVEFEIAAQPVIRYI